MLAKQDETAAKVERVSAQVRQLTVVVTNSLTTQSDNIEFLLTQTQQLTEGQARLEQGHTELKHQVNQGFAQIITLINERLKWNSKVTQNHRLRELYLGCSQAVWMNI